MFDMYTEVWQQKAVTGEAPAPGVYSAASASVDDDLFTFGGVDGRRYYNSLHRLKHATQWFELCPQNGRAESPMAKSGAGMVAFGNNLAVVGGYGKPHGPTQPGSSFIRNTGRTDGVGWTNEFHVYIQSQGWHVHMFKMMYHWMPISIHVPIVPQIFHLCIHSLLYSITNVCSV